MLRQAMIIRNDGGAQEELPVLTIQRVTLDLPRDLLLTMPVLTLQRVTLDLALTRCNVKTCIVNKR
jgi:hypothetical protein